MIVGSLRELRMYKEHTGGLERTSLDDYVEVNEDDALPPYMLELKSYKEDDV